MPALVAPADNSSYCTPVIPSPGRRHQIKGFVDVQASRSPALKLIPNKSMASKLLPPSKISKKPSVKTPLPVEEQAQGEKPFKVALDAVADTVMVQCPFQGQVFTSRESGRLVMKPRLTYDYNKLTLSIDMPTAIHEELFDCLKEHLTLAIANMPYNCRAICPRIHMNYSLEVPSKSVTSDMAISGLGECAFSEDREHVFDKMETEIEAHPEVDFAVIVLIHESASFASPLPNSTASNILPTGDAAADLQPLYMKSFILQRSTPRQFDQPLTVADHNWCQVGSVQYFVWIKGANGAPINVHDNNPLLMTLAPTVNMGAVTAMLETGLRRMRDSMVSLTLEIDNDADCSALQAANPTLPIEWDLGMSGILSAIDTTAYQRYLSWSVGVKRPNDSLYTPSDRDDTQQPLATRPHTRSMARKVASTSQPSPRKAKSRGRSVGKPRRKAGAASGSTR
ncbi:uncharacterized protein HD556DRAFT_1310164 [Suillus plorans]|uniref:Uncharacterized protein n=1 Tax=Suillus plorans TaxID=116603 RepID=A0A9P7AKB7_9AGAM|nr:uncharacterized protein HD556DRAFT_1310164 [Suillus plorans]KAG1791060.1 hypothetical protein HD556DRAFT_1310164 [Suillus plorans]